MCPATEEAGTLASHPGWMRVHCRMESTSSGRHYLSCASIVTPQTVFSQQHGNGGQGVLTQEEDKNQY